MDDLLLDPLNAYKSCYKDAFSENAETYFKNIVRESGLDVEKNRKTVKEYQETNARAQKSRGVISRYKALRAFLIFLAVVGFLAVFVGIYLFVLNKYLAGSLTLFIGAAFAVSSVTVIVVVLNGKIKHNTEELHQREQQASELLQECWTQMSPLNALFESTVTKSLIESTVPLLKIDDNFDIRRYDYLNQKYGFKENTNPNRSTIGILTGDIVGNPFVVTRELVHSMGSHTYSGSLTISWTTTYRDSNGHIQTQYHSQTLTASVTKPKPFYSKQTTLIYGNEAAPDLQFSHSPTHAEKMSSKVLEKTIKSGEKKIRKLQEKAMQSDATNFTSMGNSEFDVLFNAFDRNNEVQFRLLFTPLAQKNMISIMKDAETFGDDFTFDKRGCLNYISSEHSQSWDMDTDYMRYQTYDIDDAHSRFLGFNTAYFKSLFFDLAPLLAIPLYQQHKPKEYIYKEEYPRNYTGFEAECSANSMGRKYFCHEDTQTESILKANFLEKDGKTDRLRITAYSYVTKERVDFIPKFGGDGLMHDVPVHWVEYIPVSRESVIGLKRLDMTEKEYSKKLADTSFLNALEGCGTQRVFVRGLLCCLLKNERASLDSVLERVV